MASQNPTASRGADRIIAAAARYLSDQPEVDVSFDHDLPQALRLVDGWAEPQPEGLAALGHMSRLDLPRPVAPEAFVVSLDLSPNTESPAQRVVVIANGDVTREIVLETRQAVHCLVPRRTVHADARLTLTLLLPDAASRASAARPLDDRCVSVVLHRLTLTPLGVYARNDAAAASVLPRDRPGRTCDGSAADLFGPDVWLPAGTPMQQVVTSRGTVLFADVEAGLLRHGQVAASPRNLLLARSNGIAYLIHSAGHGSRYTVRVPPVMPDDEPTTWPDEAASGVQTFALLYTTADEASPFGLRSHGLLLSAQDDGRVSLSRRALGSSEGFLLLDPAGRTG